MHCRPSASARVAPFVSSRPSRPTASPSRNSPASACPSLGRDPDATWALRCRALGERESGTERLEQAIQAYRLALEERTRERVPLAVGRDPDEPGQCAAEARRARERHRSSRAGRPGLPPRPRGIHPRARAAPVGHDPDEPRQCAADARRARKRHRASRAGRPGLPPRPRGVHPRARPPATGPRPR